MDADDLYGLPLERFVAERNALTKRLRKERARDQAEAVAKLRKPSLAAWAVNQLVRTQRRDIAALFHTGDALRKTQAKVLAGRASGSVLREQMEAERVAVRVLAERARGLLSSEGHELTSAVLDRVSETLHAAALDEDARAQVQSGRLERQLRHVGLGALDAESIPARRSARSASTKAVSQRIEQEARRRAQRAGRDLETAERRYKQATQALHHAEEELDVARQRAREADTKLRQARRGRPARHRDVGR